MKEGFRQSMAWLHTWSGLLVGWVLFLVFAAGTAAYFRDEISLWMRPELHGVGAAGPVDAAAATALAVRHLQTKAPDSLRWTINLPTAREPAVRVSWSAPPSTSTPPAEGERSRRARFETAALDPATGAPLATARQTRGGDFFFRLHFDLHHMPVQWGRWLVGACAMFMLVAIASGIVTHKRIFADFFTFRPNKGQRSWLDAHTTTAVLALPYHLMITYTGLVTLMFMYMPWGQQAVYQADRATYIAEVFLSSGALGNQPAAGIAAPLLPVADLVRQASATWQGAPAGRVIVNHPGDASAKVTVYRAEAGSISSHQAFITFSGADGQLLARGGEHVAPASQTRGVLYGLHLGRFAHPLVRWLLFVSGLAGCAMVATGLLLWAVKKRERDTKALAEGARVGFARRLVDGLNVGVIAGLPLAMASFFCANRLVPVGLPERPAAEITVFFCTWALALVAGLAWPARRMWQLQLGIGGAAFALLPVLNPLTGGVGLWTAVRMGLWPVAGFDLVVVLLGAALLGACRWLGRREPGASPLAQSRPGAGLTDTGAATP